MPLQTSGQIAMGDIVTELDIGGPGQYTLNDANFRTLAGVASGEIELADFYGKSAEVLYDMVVQPDYVVFASQYVTSYTSEYTANPSVSGQGGTIDDDTIVEGNNITFGGRSCSSTNLICTRVGWFGINSTNANSFVLYMKRTGSTGTTSLSNSGFTAIEYYADQSNDSGSPTFTFNRTAASSFGNSNYTGYSEAYWFWNMANLGVTHPLSAYMGNSGTPSTNGDQYFKFTGIV
jgi:hypothetical protein